MTLPRGPYALSRLSGVPLYPMTKRWQQGAVQIEIGPPLEPPPNESLAARHEDALATQAIRWLEPQLSSETQIPRHTLLRKLLKAPMIAGVDGAVSSTDNPR